METKYQWQKSDKNIAKTPEFKEKMRKLRLGKKLSEETKAKIKQSLKATIEKPEIKEKWRKAQMGRKHSQATKDKIQATKKKKYPPTIPQLKRKADIVFSKYIRLRDSIEINGERIGNCITCNTAISATGRGGGHAGHFVSRRHMITRYDERNVNLQCASCNLYHAGEQYQHARAIDNKYGTGVAEELHNTRNQEFIVTRDWLEGIIKTYKKLSKA